MLPWGALTRAPIKRESRLLQSRVEYACTSPGIESGGNTTSGQENMRRMLLITAVVLFGAFAGAQAQDAPTTPTEQTAAKPPAALEAAPATSPARDEPAPEWWQRSDWWLVISMWAFALIALALVAYTSKLWKATSQLLKTTADAGKRELRAYVALDEIFFEEAGESAPGVHKLRMRNYGQTPAYRMSIWCERASHLPKEGVTPYYETPVIDGQLLHPVQAYTVALAAAPLYRIGKAGFFTYGRIVYHDIYGEWWVTKFCFRYEGEGSFVPHGDYNDEEGPFDKRPT